MGSAVTAGVLAAAAYNDRAGRRVRRVSTPLVDGPGRRAADDPDGGRRGPVAAVPTESAVRAESAVPGVSAVSAREQADDPAHESAQQPAVEQARSHREPARMGGSVALAVVLTICLLAVPTLWVRSIAGAYGGEPARVAPVASEPVEQITPPWQDIGPAWEMVPAMVPSTVDATAALGFSSQFCVRAVDDPRLPTECAGAETPMYPASVIKPVLAVAVVEEYWDRLDTPVPVTWDQIRGGSGVVQFSGAGSYTVRDLVDYALSVSDNTATVALLALLGSVEKANAPLMRMPHPPTFRIGNFGGALWSEGYDNGEVTARGGMEWLTELVRCADGVPCAMASRHVAEYVINAMRGNEWRSSVTGSLDAGTFYSKNGNVNLVNHEIAVIDTERGRVIATVVSSAFEGSGPSWVVSPQVRSLVDSINHSRIDPMGEPAAPTPPEPSDVAL